MEAQTTTDSNPERKVINFDLDGVLADTHTALASWYNDRYGHLHDKPYRASDIKTWDITQSMHPSVGKDGWDFFKSTSMYNSIDPIPDSQRVTEALVDAGYIVQIVTSTWQNRSGQLWALKHFPHIPTYIHTMDKHLVPGDAMVDDKAENLLGGPWTKYLFYADHSAAFDVSGTDIIRVGDMEHLAKLLGVEL